MIRCDRIIRLQGRESLLQQLATEFNRVFPLLLLQEVSDLRSRSRGHSKIQPRRCRPTGRDVTISTVTPLSSGSDNGAS